MNLYYKYPRVYWNTSVLTIEAGANEDSKHNKGTDYGKVAKAIGQMQENGIEVALPNINKAHFGFKPDAENDRIIFGLKAIHGIGDDIVREIIDNRPYKSFDDFLQRMVFIDNSVVKQSHVIQLIKAGVFDEVETMSREDIMTRYMTIVSEPKSNLNMQNFPMVVRLNLTPEKYALEVRFFNYRNYIYSKKPYKVLKNTNPNVKKKIDDRWYLLDDISTAFYFEHFNEDNVIEYVGTNIVISRKEFDKEYQKKMEPVKEWISQKDVVETLNKKLFQEAWNKHASGKRGKWEMDSLSYYYHDHELININKEKYGVKNFFEMSPDPVISEWITTRKSSRPKFQIDRIAGTVLDRDKYKKTVSLLTTEGVVTVKFYAGAFGHYDKQMSIRQLNGKKKVIENSWFTRGARILVAGYRRDSQFIPKVYKDTIYQHTVSLIREVKDNGDLIIQSEREMGD